MHLTIFTSLLMATSTLAGPQNGWKLNYRSLLEDIRTSFSSTTHSSYKKQQKRDEQQAFFETRCRIKDPGAALLLNNTHIPTSPSSSPGAPIHSTTSSQSAPTQSSDGGTPPPPPPPPPEIESPWSLVHSHEGSSFFDKWNFWSDRDPTNGVVDYRTREECFSDNLIEVNSAGHAIMRVDTTRRISGDRKSVRLHDTYTFNAGHLVLMDAVHMPRGCGTWPAFWSNGPNWPSGGEIDILEGVHDLTRNQATIHTSPGCNVPADVSPATGERHGNTWCHNTANDNLGCGYLERGSNSYGGPFNDVGGGVYAMVWLENEIRVHFFSRDDVPDDITTGRPLPETWPAPVGYWSDRWCDISSYFNNHHTIFDTTFCGDWAGSPSSWTDSGCAASTGYSNCADYVRENGHTFEDAYWEVKYVRIYSL